MKKCVRKWSELICAGVFAAMLVTGFPLTSGAAASRLNEVHYERTVQTDFESLLNTVLGFAIFAVATQQRLIQETQESRDATVTKIVTSLPDTASVGGQIALNAVPYDSNDIPVSGVDLKWTVTGPDGQIRSVTNGLVTFDRVGLYDLSVSGAGTTSLMRIQVDDSFEQYDPFGLMTGIKAESPDILPLEEWNPNNIHYAHNPRNERGNPPGVPKENTNFNIAAPVLSVKGRADLGLDLNLVYNSRVWTKMGGDISFDMDKDSPAPGWTLGFGKIANFVTGGIVQFGEDGSKRFFAGALRTETNRQIFEGQSTDGSFVKARVTTYGSVINGVPCYNSNNYAYVKYPDGTTVTYGNWDVPYPGCVVEGTPITMVPTRIQDKHGNYVSIAYYPGTPPQDGRFINYITDDLGRVYTFNYTLIGGRYYLTSVTGPGLRDENGVVTQRTFVRINYKNHTLGYNFSGLEPRVRDNNNSIKVLSSVYYPATNTGFWFGDLDSYSPYGMIRKVEEQKGMSYDSVSGIISAGQMIRRRTYAYPENTTVPISDLPEYNTVSETWDGMPDPSSPATTIYQVDWSASPRMTTVILPYQAGKTVEYSYNNSTLPDTDPEKAKDGISFKTEFYDANNNLRSRDEVDWGIGTLSFFAHGNTGSYALTTPRPNVITHTEVESGVSLVKKSVYDTYGPYNRVQEMHEIGYVNETLRRNTTAYVDKNDALLNENDWPGIPRIINLPSTEEVFDGSNNRIDHKEYTYDLAPILARQDVVHNQTCTPSYQCPPEFYATRGNLSNIVQFSRITNSTLDGPYSDGRQYDSAGNVYYYNPSSGGGADQRYWTYTSATGFAYPETLSQGSGSVQNAQISVTSTFDFNTGLPLTVRGANEVQTPTSFEYELATWRLRRTNFPTGSYKINDFDDLNRVYTKTDYTSSQQVAGKQVNKINGLSLSYRQESLAMVTLGQEIYDVVEAEYDNQGRIKRTSNPFRSNEQLHGTYWSELFYDYAGRVERSREPDGSEKFTYFDETIRPNVATAAPGHTVRSKDSVGREKWHRTDVDGNVVEVVEPYPDGDGSVATNGFLTQHFYDKMGRLVRVEQGSQVRRFSYDGLSRLTAQKMAETAATLDENGVFVGQASGQWSEFFTYDQMSNVSTSTDSRGVKTTYSYQNPAIPFLPIDPLNRLFSIQYDLNGASNVLAAPTVKFEYQPYGNVSQMTSVYSENIVNGNTQRVVTDTFAYDSFGRINQKTTTIPNRSPFTIGYSYDSLGRVTDTLYPAQYGVGSSPRKNVHSDFDLAGRRSRLSVDNTDYASEPTFNSFDELTSIKIGPIGANQITEQYTYDLQNGRLQNQKTVRTGTALLDLSYSYQQCACTTGGNGQIVGIVNNLDRNKDRVFEYDKLARLKKVTGGINQSWTQTYTYDRFGNRLSVQAQGFEALRPTSGLNHNNQKIVEGSIGDSQIPTTSSLLQNVQDVANPKRTGENVASSPKLITPGKKASERETLETVNRTPFDFDGDHKADYSTWRRYGSSIGTWTIRNSVTGQDSTDLLGNAGNQIAPADYDGDGKTDKAVWNPSTGAWTVKRSIDGNIVTANWGTKGDAIVPADYDGDGKADFAVWRPSNGVWYIIRSSNQSTYTVPFGGQQYGDIPSVGDFDGDGLADITVWRPSNGVWVVFILGSKENKVLYFQWGVAGDVPVADDYDGDQVTDVAVWRPSAGMWYILQSTNGQMVAVPFGGLQFGDVPVPADYDGDGRADVAVWRPSTSYWYSINSSNGAVVTQPYGTTNDLAVPSAYRRRSSAPNNQNKEILPDGHASLTYDSNTNRITNTGFEYDYSGNQTRAVQTDGSFLRFQYDAAGRLTKVKLDNGTTITTYTYGIGRQRIATQEGDENSTNITYYVWNSSTVISEYSESSGAAQWARNYVYFEGSLLATQFKTPLGESVQFDHADTIGTRAITDPGSGTFLEQTTLPFGTALESESSGSIKQRFTTYDRSPSSGLDYATNRFYDAKQGRFTTVDPITMGSTKILNPQTLNLYSYTANDPVNRTDPSGLDGIWGGNGGPVLGGQGSSGHTGSSFFSGLGQFLTGLLGNLFGSGHSYAGTFGHPTYFWQFNTGTVTPAAPPPLPGAGTIRTFAPPPPDLSSLDCLSRVLEFLRSYASAEGGWLDGDAGKLVSALLTYMQSNNARVEEATFALANAYHETDLFRQFTEAIGPTCRGYRDGGCDYRGRGFIHLTLKANYDAFFINHLQRTPGTRSRGWGSVSVPAYVPSEAADTPIALQVMSWYFLNRGTYAYLNLPVPDYLGARRTINPKEPLGKKIGSTTVRQRIIGLTNGLEPILKGC